MAEETKALTSRPKAFSLPAAPDLAGFKTELGPIPQVADYEKVSGELKTSKDIGAEQTRQLGRLEKAEQDIGAAQLATQQFKAGAEADIARQTREGAQDIEAGLDTIRQRFPHPQFHPTQENVQSMATLFSLIGLVGTGMGGGGKMSAMNALVSMNGMLKGWQQGRKDLFEREKVEFDKNMARVKAILDDAYRDADRAYKTLAYNREEAQALAGQSAAKLGGQVGKQILEKQGIERYVNFLDGIKKDVKETEKLASETRIQELRIEEQRKREDARFAQQEKLQNQRFAQQWQLLNARLDAQDRKPKPLDAKTHDKNISMVRGIRGIESLQSRLRDPDIQIGLTSKIAPLLQKITSFSDTTDFERAVNTTLTANDKTTLFLKDALLETYAIEKAAKDGQRLTVQDMKMVGPVLDPTNYTPKAYNALLEGRRKILYENLQDNGLSIDQINEMKRKPREVEPFGGSAELPTPGAKQKPANAPADAKQAADGNWYSPDPKRPGKYLKWE
jgi:hypothetical protein